MNKCVVCEKPSGKRKHCSQGCIAKDIELRNADKPQKMVSHGLCSECGNPIMRWPTGGTKPKTCSDECKIEKDKRRGRERTMLMRKLLGKVNRKCDWCENSIDHLSLNSKYCCENCADKAHKERQQARYAKRAAKKRQSSNQEITDKTQLFICGRL